MHFWMVRTLDQSSIITWKISPQKYSQNLTDTNCNFCNVVFFCPDNTRRSVGERLNDSRTSKRLHPMSKILLGIVKGMFAVTDFTIPHNYLPQARRRQRNPTKDSRQPIMRCLIHTKKLMLAFARRQKAKGATALLHRSPTAAKNAAAASS